MASLLQPLYDELEANYPIQVWSGLFSTYLYIPIVSSMIYLALFNCGRKYMEERPALKLRKVLTLWNATLAIFSILGTIVVLPPLIQNLSQKDGFYQSVCFSPLSTTPWLSFWAAIFTLSKLVEFGDTFFIVFRKTPLNFLHWYHHISVFLYSWYGMGGMADHDASLGHWFCSMNFFVHSVMYTYYTFKSTGIRVSSIVSKCITLLQLSQFFVGLVVTLAAIWYYVREYECDMKLNQLVSSFVLYGSYMALFLNFFYQRYVKSAPLNKQKKER